MGLYQRGYTTFLTGITDGFEMMTAGGVLQLRMKYPKITLVAVIPFMGQELGYSAIDKERYEIIYELANERIFVSDIYHSGARMFCQEYLLRNSAATVSYQDVKHTEMMYIYNRAVS